MKQNNIKGNPIFKDSNYLVYLNELTFSVYLTPNGSKDSQLLTNLVCNKHDKGNSLTVSNLNINQNSYDECMIISNIIQFIARSVSTNNISIEVKTPCFLKALLENFKIVTKEEEMEVNCYNIYNIIEAVESNIFILY